MSWTGQTLASESGFVYPTNRNIESALCFLVGRSDTDSIPVDMLNSGYHEDSSAQSIPEIC